MPSTLIRRPIPGFPNAERLNLGTRAVYMPHITRGRNSIGTMRIALFSTSRIGGAGIASIRYSESLNSIGVRNDLFALPNDKQKTSDQIQDIQRTHFEKYKSKTLTITQQRIFQKEHDLLTPLSTGLESVNKLIRNYDLINLHSSYNILNHRNFKELIQSKKRIVLTLHDQRWFTGGCHYSGACIGYQGNCKQCPQATKVGKYFVRNSMKQNIKLLSSYSNLRVIAPSNWLAEKARESVLLAGSEIKVIRNPIPSFETSSQKLKETPSIKQIRIVFVSDNLQNPLKGLDLLISAFNLMSEEDRSKFQLLLIGRNSPNVDIFPLDVRITVVKNHESLCAELRQQDYLVVPSRQDNLPNVIGEAFSAGIRVLGSNAGGIPEVITPETGEIFENGNPDDLAKKLLRISKVYPKSKVLEHFKLNFNYEKVAKEILSVYLD